MKQRINNKKYKYFLNTALGKKFVNCLMVQGGKNKAERILIESLVLIKAYSAKNPVNLLILGVSSVKPIVEVRSIRMRGANYQVPIPLKEERRTSLAIKWVIESARKKKGSPMKSKLKDELILASRKQGESVKKKLAIHRLANNNRAFAHFRWF